MTDQKDTNNIKASYGELTEFPKMVFGVMGSAGGEVPKTVRERAWTSPIWYTPTVASPPH